MFARIVDDFFRCSGLSKISVFRWTIQNIMTGTPPLYFDTDNHCIVSQKSVLHGDNQHEGVQTYKFET